MIQKLYIKNYALIDAMEINFQHGFSVITGETGAGKSILLGALSLLLGQRADGKAIRQGEQKCIIEACFSFSKGSLENFFRQNDLDYDDQGTCIVRREIQSNGKSRAFVNDTPVSLTILKALSSQLIDIHSQHRNLFLADASFQLNVVDIIAAHSDLLARYGNEYTLYQNTSKELIRLKEAALKQDEEADYLTFQYNQLKEAGLYDKEQEDLEQEQASLSHAEEIKNILYKTDQIMVGENISVLSALNDALHLLSDISSYLPQGEEWYERLNSNLIDLKDLTDELSNQQERIEYNPQRLETVNERLDLIYSLQKKHRVNTVEELLEIEKRLENQLQANDSLKEQIEETEQLLQAAYRQVEATGQQLSANRKKVIPRIEKQMIEMLKELGMPNIRFEIKITPHAYDNTGGDSILFLFSANKNATLQPVSDIASGGEIARVMLTLKALIADAISLPTIIFDEIDTGVSGEIAGKMARIMQKMGRTMQVITITHLPQIASKGVVHYKVYKEDNANSTITHIRQLTPKERINELAGMLSNGVLSEAALNNARSLLKED